MGPSAPKPISNEVYDYLCGQRSLVTAKLEENEEQIPENLLRPLYRLIVDVFQPIRNRLGGFQHFERIEKKMIDDDVPTDLESIKKTMVDAAVQTDLESTKKTMADAAMQTDLESNKKITADAAV